MLVDTQDAIDTIAISILTGFLGSGKTTLLNHLLNHPDIDETAVLINEFGEVGLDHLLVTELSDDVVLLSSGCICCTVQGELVDSLKSLYMRRLAGQVPAFKRVIIETTGLADPIPIITCIMKDPLFKHTYRLESLVTTVDGIHGAEQIDRHPEALRQAAVADRIIITKIDMATEATIAALRQRLTDLNPGARILTASHGRVSPDRLFDVALYDAKSKTLDVQRWLNEEAYTPKSGNDHSHGHGHDGHSAAHGVDVNRHDDHIAAFCIYLDQPVAWQPFLEWLEDLTNEKGERILRIKGMVNVAGEDAPYVVQCVQATRSTPNKLPAWPDGDRRSRIVFITYDLPRDEIEASLALANITTPVISAAAGEEAAGATPSAGGHRQSAGTPRTRWLNDGEIAKLLGALLEHRDQPHAYAVRLMLLTGSPMTAILGARWEHFDLTRGTWMKPNPNSPAGRPRRVRLSPPALQVLRYLRDQGEAGSGLFSPDGSPRSLPDIRAFWAVICKTAGVEPIDLDGLRPTMGSHIVAGLDPVLRDRLLGLPATTAGDVG